MPIYKGTTELTKIADFIAATEHDITEVYFGDKQVFTVWGEYDGALPAAYSANGSMLSDYRIYGAAGGVGDETANVYAKNTTRIYNAAIVSATNKWSSVATSRSIKIPCNPATQYTLSVPSVISVFKISLSNDAEIEPIASGTMLDDEIYLNGNAKQYTFTTNNATQVIIFQGSRDGLDEWYNGLVLTEGSTAPSSFIPYGYEVDISISDGTTEVTTPIYIGDTPLGEDEYVDYAAGKIYRMVNGVLTPTDPPVPLPALTTVDGINVVDYAGQSAAVPSRFMAKYRKEGY